MYVWVQFEQWTYFFMIVKMQFHHAPTEKPTILRLTKTNTKYFPP